MCVCIKTHTNKQTNGKRVWSSQYEQRKYNSILLCNSHTLTRFTCVITSYILVVHISFQNVRFVGKQPLNFFYFKSILNNVEITATGRTSNEVSEKQNSGSRAK